MDGTIASVAQIYARELPNLKDQKMKKQRLKRWFKKWLNDGHHEDSEFFQDSADSSTVVIKVNFDVDVEPVRLNIYRADGGIIIESKIYDSANNQYNSRLHIVNHDQDLGSALSKIITMETLRV
jgi:hypothetical protein